MRTFNVIVERDPDTGIFVGSVPGWPGAHIQGETLDELEKNLHEVNAMLPADGDPKLESEFVGLQTNPGCVGVGSVPVLKPREVAAFLVRLGFQEVRVDANIIRYLTKDDPFSTAF